MSVPLPKGDGRRRRQGSQVLSLPLSGSFEIVFEHEVTVAPRQFADRDGIPPLWWLVFLKKPNTPQPGCCMLFRVSHLLSAVLRRDFGRFRAGELFCKEAK